MRTAHFHRLFALLFAIAAPGAAQTTVAPSEETVGSVRGEDVRGYNITNSWEVGYRMHTVGGNQGKYRSDVNFGNGPRLLGSHLDIHSRDGHGRLFDELVLSTQGLGNDPYQFVNLRLRKNRLYEYSFLWRSNDFFNPALTISGGQHLLDTTRRWQDHDFTLFPDSRFQALLGYGRNTQDGPGLTTTNLFGRSGDEFPVFADIRRQTNEYRLGGDAHLRHLRLRITRVWENFKDDTPQAIPVVEEGDKPGDQVALSSFRRLEPYHGNSPSWRGVLLADQGKWLTIDASGSYTGSDRNFIVDETAGGSDVLGGAFDRQVLVFGAGRRPVGAGNVTISLFPFQRLTIANHTAYYNVRMEGDSDFRQFNNRTLEFQRFSFQALGIRTIVNTTDVNYRAWRWFGFYGGYHYSTRRIRSKELATSGDFEDVVTAEQENTLQAGRAGVHIQPVGPLTINLEGEVGRADRPFYPISEKNYHLLGGRIQYKTPALLLSAATRIHYNTNSVTLSSHSSRSRNYAFDFSWTPTSRFAVDAGYNKMHLDTLSGIAYFAAFRLVEGERSSYVSNVHAVNIGAHMVLTHRLNIYAGYSRVQDTGDGRNQASLPPPGADPGSALPAFVAAQTFPLTFQSPAARLSLKFSENLRWNAGYQYYHYKEDFLTLQNYRAHTGYTSLEWSF